MIPLKLYIWAAIALAFAGVLWHDHHQTKRANRLAEKANVLQASLVAEQESRRKADESANRYAKRINALRGPRSPPPVLLCKLPRSVPHASIAASGTDASPVADDSGVLEDVDIGPRLDLSFLACEANLIKLEELQRWVRER